LNDADFGDVVVPITSAVAADTRGPPTHLSLSVAWSLTAADQSDPETFQSVISRPR